MIYPAVLCWLTLLPGDCAELPPDKIIVVEEKAIALTRPDGSKIWVNPKYVAYIRPPMSTEQGNAVIVYAHGARQSVRETPDQIKGLARELEDKVR